MNILFNMGTKQLLWVCGKCSKLSSKLNMPLFIDMAKQGGYADVVNGAELKHDHYFVVVSVIVCGPAAVLVL